MVLIAARVHVSPCLLTFFPLARHKRIAHIVQLTAADRIVSDDHATGILAARARTRVDAALIDARPVLRAIGADDALGPTVGRCADAERRAGADGELVVQLALAVGATGRRVAGIDGGDYGKAE